MSQTGGIWILRLQMDEVAKLSVKLFGEESTYYVPDATPSAGP